MIDVDECLRMLLLMVPIKKREMMRGKGGLISFLVLSEPCYTAQIRKPSVMSQHLVMFSDKRVSSAYAAREQYSAWRKPSQHRICESCGTRPDEVQ